ncbi:hypothetical protein BGZ95_006330 [Linnemannia exigua]|uniref:Glycosyltransferase 61 catalytic domain-containing protein n=1 Tax=Linnemannia exigua TaxID=604196 RepID=A0AAD4DGG4_9FUNG|nr:hypothetical protein BGZ95_006330 [Linnemannia exigua]
MLPLYSTMKRFNGTKDSWSFKVNSYYNEHNPKNQGRWEMRHIFPTGFELVLLKEELVTEFQTLPPSDAPICFRQAVIGLGSQCALEYCEKNIPSDVYHSFRDVIAEYYWKTPDTWRQHIMTTQDHFGAGAQTRLAEATTGGSKKRFTIAPASTVADTVISHHHAKTQKSSLKCLDLARYYNFEPSSGASPLEPLKESRNRAGFRVPDAVDPEVTQSQKGRRRLVVAMIQREGSRRIINDQELVEGLAIAGFRVKWITFDHGCGIAETAYLLRDVHVLASPHGNAIGTSIFMPTTNPVPTLISLDPSKYSEPWFINTATVLGHRFLSAACGPHGYADEATKARCPYYKDLAGAHKGLGIWGTKIVLGLSDELAQSYRDKVAQGNLTEEALQEFRDYVASNAEAQQLAKEELDIMIGPELPMTVVKKYDAEIIWFFLEVFWRDVPRYADVPRVVALVQELQKDQEREQVVAITGGGGGVFTPEPKYKQYLDYIRRNRACGVKEFCRPVLQRNVIARSRAFGIHSIDDPARWGQPEDGSEVNFEGLEESRSNWSMA